MFALSVIGTSILAYHISVCIFTPLRKFNSRLSTVRQDGNIVELRSEDFKSDELDDMYKTFQLLIQSKRFENNSYKDK